MIIKDIKNKLKIPVIGAPLFIVSNPELVIAQCKAGIIGSFPALNARPKELLDDWLYQIKDALDEHDKNNPNQPSYSEDFIKIYRDSQITRNRKITSWVQQKLEDYRKQGEENREFGFVVHRTMADPKWLDPNIDPNGRKPNWCFLGEPEVVNNSPIGLARYCYLRSWMSQWSYDYARGDGISCAKLALDRANIPINNLANVPEFPKFIEVFFFA